MSYCCQFVIEETKSTLKSVCLLFRYVRHWGDLSHKIKLTLKHIKAYFLQFYSCIKYLHVNCLVC